MRTIIIDDEKPAIKILTTFVLKIPFLHLELATTNAFEGLELLNTQKIDLLLLDIEMPDITGLELLKSLDQKPMVIFTTAYENYALQGYDLDIVDYLVKPIPFERFLKGINKAHKLYGLTNNTIEPTKPDHLLLKVEYKTIKIAFDDILYIEGLKDYVKVYTKQKMFLTRLNLKGIEAKLPPTDFLRIHRSYIVSLAKVTSFQKSQLFIDNKDLPVGNAYRDEVVRKLN